jgi:hypothetical protein
MTLVTCQACRNFQPWTDSVSGWGDCQRDWQKSWAPGAGYGMTPNAAIERECGDFEERESVEKEA